MSSLETFYQKTIRAEIEQLEEEISLALKDSDVASLYYGWKAWFSQIEDNPDVLFIGFNPGSGEGNYGCDLDPDGELQYLYDKSKTWSMKNDTLEVFRDHILKNRLDLSKSIKTNYYYIATPKANDIFRITGSLSSNRSTMSLSQKFFQKSRDWTAEILKRTNPKVIICEGAKAFDMVTEYGIGHKVSRKENAFSAPRDYFKVPVIGYVRNRYQGAGIKDPEQLISELRAVL